MMKYVHCIKQVDERLREYYIVECFESYKEAKQRKTEYEDEYHQDYYVESVRLHLKKEKENE